MSATPAAVEQRDLTTIQSDIEQALCRVHTLLEEYYSNASSKLEPYAPKVIERKGFDIRTGETHQAGRKAEPYRCTEFKSNLSFTVPLESYEEEKVTFLGPGGLSYGDCRDGAEYMEVSVIHVCPSVDLEVFVASKARHSAKMKTSYERSRTIDLRQKK